MSAVQVNFKDLKERVDAGWKRAELAKHYGLKESQMARCLKDCGLKIRKFHKPVYQIIGMPNQDSIDSESNNTQLKIDVVEKENTELPITDEAPVWAK